MHLGDLDVRQFFIDRCKTVSNGCIEWTGTMFPSGYGRVNNNRIYKKLGIQRAHILSWVLSNGKYNKSLYVCHTCHNRACVNINHLYLGTPKDNIQDMLRAKRGLLGEKNPRASLNKEKVLLIRKYVELGLRPIDIANKLGISRHLVYDIQHKRTWRHL